MWLAWIGGMAMAGELDLLERDLEWRSVDDTVMGGVSAGRVRRSGDGLRFEGTVSLDNNGGFSSVRTRPADLGLAGTTAFRLRLRGDGHTYDFTLRRRDLPIRGGSWRATFTTTGEVQEITLPLDAFEATSFGRALPDAPSLTGAGARIDSIGFLIADKQEGSFQLQVLSIQAVGASTRTDRVEPTGEAP